jgi:hypothetical protein
MMVATAACATVLVGPAQAQRPDHAADLNAEVARLYRAGKYAEATEIGKRALAIAEKALGPNHPDVGMLPGGGRQQRAVRLAGRGCPPITLSTVAIRCSSNCK